MCLFISGANLSGYFERTDSFRGPLFWVGGQRWWHCGDFYPPKVVVKGSDCLTTEKLWEKIATMLFHPSKNFENLILKTLITSTLEINNRGIVAEMS